MFNFIILILVLLLILLFNLKLEKSLNALFLLNISVEQRSIYILNIYL